MLLILHKRRFKGIDRFYSFSQIRQESFHFNWETRGRLHFEVTPRIFNNPQEFQTILRSMFKKKSLMMPVFGISEGIVGY